MPKAKLTLRLKLAVQSKVLHLLGYWMAEERIQGSTRIGINKYSSESNTAGQAEQIGTGGESARRRGVVVGREGIWRQRPRRGGEGRGKGVEGGRGRFAEPDLLYVRRDERT